LHRSKDESRLLLPKWQYETERFSPTAKKADDHSKVRFDPHGGARAAQHICSGAAGGIVRAGSNAQKALDTGESFLLITYL
jgi:hypothetical protein